MKILIFIFLSFISTSCGAQDWYDKQTDKGKQEFDNFQDQWIIDRAKDVAKAHREMMFNILTSSTPYKVNIDRCSDHSLCMSIAKTEQIRQLFYSYVENKSKNLLEEKTLFENCENFRNSRESIIYFSNSLLSQIKEMEKRASNPSMGDILQFGDRKEEIAIFYLENLLLINKTKIFLTKIDYIFNYIYPSEKYESVLKEEVSPFMRSSL